MARFTIPTTGMNHTKRQPGIVQALDRVAADHQEHRDPVHQQEGLRCQAEMSVQSGLYRTAHTPGRRARLPAFS